MNLPRLVTSVVVTVVVVFLVWWFMIHKSISEKEGESKTAELVQKQRDVKEMKDRSQGEAASTAVGEETGTDTGEREIVTAAGDQEVDRIPEKPAEKPVEEKIVDDEPAVGEAAAGQAPPISELGTATPAPEGSHYAVHVASFRETGRAGQETDYLEKKGHSAVVIATEVSGQTWYRVYVGEYRTREEAAAMRLQLLDLSRIGYARVVTLKDSNN